MATATMSRRDIEAAIVGRTWKDASFKHEFLADPKGTVEKYSGQAMPASFKIVVHEEDPNTMHISLPLPPANVGELSEDDLEKVAGGTDIIGAAIIGAIAATVAAGATIANDQTRARAGW
jgi:hypothetical protein